MEETFGDRLSRLRKAANLSRQQLADAIGVSRSAITLLENGQSKSMDTSNLLRAAAAMGVNPYDLEFGEKGAQQVMEKLSVNEANLNRYAGLGAARSYQSRMTSVPIIGFAVATPDEDGYFDDQGFPTGAGHGYIPWPTKDPNAYALEVRKDSMAPRIRPGEHIVVEPNSAVEPGDDVLVRTRDGRKMVKQLLMKRGSEITLGSINQAHRQKTISLEEIESMHFIAGIVPRGARVQEEP